MKKNKTFLFTVNKKGHAKSNPDLLRIILSPDYTKIDFGCTAKEMYIKGGWICMEKDTFIEIKETGKCYVLSQAIGIPINPEHHYFESKKDWRYFSLYFPAIPQIDCTINIIEIENGSRNNFNYYDIELKMFEGVETLELCSNVL
jgi:hypothetical protein